MKQGINFILPIKVGIDTEAIEEMEFLFKQKDKQLEFLYPSDKTSVRDDGIIDLKWTKEETYLFESGSIELDTRIKLKDTDEQPITPIVKVYLRPTLFEEEHEHD